MKSRIDWRIWLLFVVGLFITLLASFFVKSKIDKIAEAEFVFECNEITHKIDIRLHSHAQLLRSGAAFFGASESVSREQWRNFIAKSRVDKDLPGILGTGFSLIIPQKDLGLHCKSIRSEGFPNYKVWPEQDRDIYTSIVLLEPFSGRNLRAFGYDMMTESVRREAMERARDLDLAALSGKVLLVQETKSDVQAGNLMYVPVYKKGVTVTTIEQRQAAIIGWVYSPYRMNDLVAGILDGWELKKDKRTLLLDIYDGTECSSQSILFKSYTLKDKIESEKIRFTLKTPVDFNGHVWTLVFTQESGNVFINYVYLWLVLLGGLLISILIFLLSRSLTDTKHKAQEIARKLTIELKESERLLRESQKIAKLGSYSLDVSTGIWESSDILDAIFGINKDYVHSIEGWSVLIHPEHSDELKEYLNNVISEEKFFDKEYKIVRNNDNEERWIHGLGKLEFDRKHNPVRLIGTISDITDRKLAEREIHNITSRLQLAASAANIGIWDFDIVNDKLVWDGTMYKLYGISAEMFTGAYEAWNTTLHPDDLIRGHEEIQMALRGEKEFDTEFRVVWPDKSIRYLKASGIVSYDTLGNPVRMLGINMDITDRKRSEEEIIKHRENMEEMVSERTQKLTISEKKLKKSLKDISDYKFALEESSIVVITDNKGIINFVNDNFCKISKFSREELLGQTHQIINSGHHSTDFFIDLWSTISKGKVWRGEIKNKAKDKSFYWVDSTIVPFLDENGKPYQYVAIRFDITPKKIVEADLINAKEEADSANRAKSEFLANMSHEIRTPMNVVIGFSDLLSKSVKEEKQRSQVESIRSSGKNLLKIINDILDLSKVEAGKIEIIPVPVDLQNLVREIENMFLQKVDEKGILFSVEYASVMHKMILLDEVRIRQILFNLIGNAIKFTDKGHVILSLDIQTNHKENKNFDIIFQIEDTGIGIPIDQQELIFEPFSQQKGQSSKYGGTGLGLPITKKLIEKMGGTITLESEVGVGSNITVVIPNISISNIEIEDTENLFDPSIVKFNKAKILLVDDKKLNRKLIKDILEHSELDIFEAENGEEAVRLAIENQPDLILMDLRMPVMDGYEATEILKQTKSTKSIPIIAISASTRKVISGNRTKKIFNEFIMKPLDASDLLDKMKKYLKYTTEDKITIIDNQDVNITLSEEELNNLPELITILENKFVPICDSVIKSQMIDQIEEFGKDLVKLANEINIQFLKDYANKVCILADNFEIDKLLKTLERFPKIILQLKINNHNLNGNGKN